MLKILVVWGWKQQWKRTNRGKIYMKKCVQNSTKSIEKVKSPTEIIKIILDVEKAGGLGLKTTMKKDKQGQNLHEKMCPEFHQINGKG